ncbi:MAG: hypothetical protein IJB24_00665 [Clostridia bacterium]|nr:hypothetical protein [Clostridia bacterium]
MKRIITLFIVSVMVLSVLSGCGDGRVKFSSEKEMRTRFEGVYEFVDDVYIINGDTMLEITNIEDLIDVENIDSFLENELKDVDINADLELNDYVQFFPDNTKEYEITYDLENNQISYNDRYIIAVDNTGIQTDTGEIAYKNDYFAFSIDLRKDFADFLLALKEIISERNDIFVSVFEFQTKTLNIMPDIKNWEENTTDAMKEYLPGTRSFEGKEGYYSLSAESYDLHIYSPYSQSTDSDLRVRMYNDDGVMVVNADDERTNRNLKESITFAHAALSDDFDVVGADELYELYNENRERVYSEYLGYFYEYELVENSVRYLIMELDDRISVDIREWNK